MSTYEIVIFVCGLYMSIIGLALKSSKTSEKLMINAPIFLCGISCMFYSFASSGAIKF